MSSEEDLRFNRETINEALHNAIETSSRIIEQYMNKHHDSYVKMEEKMDTVFPDIKHNEVFKIIDQQGSQEQVSRLFPTSTRRKLFKKGVEAKRIIDKLISEHSKMESDPNYIPDVNQLRMLKRLKDKNDEIAFIPLVEETPAGPLESKEDESKLTEELEILPESDNEPIIVNDVKIINKLVKKGETIQNIGQMLVSGVELENIRQENNTFFDMIKKILAFLFIDHMRYTIGIVILFIIVTILIYYFFIKKKKKKKQK